MGPKGVNDEGLETSNGKPDLNELSSYSKFSTEQVKLINKLRSMRDSIISMVKNRFPMKGLDAIIKQAFDEALARNLAEIKNQFLKTFYDKFQKTQTENEPSRKFSQTFEGELNNLHSKSELKKPSDNLKMSKNLSTTNSFPARSTESSNFNSTREDYQKRVDQLVLEIKSRDKKLKEQEEQIETLKNQLELLEQQNIPPFLESWRIGKEYGEEDIEQLRNQIRRWEILWQKLKPFFGKDPKFRTLFILQRLGSISVNNLSEALKLDSNQTEKILQELQESSFIIVEGDSVRINSDN
ncbi:MAG: hypothetical protein ACETWM_06795 [Candidatus Lokiarchaeia archaeon]